ncbi:unnamed protein product [Closterium sp. Yama58-4]|nr:unnamed protein product [Closterium sp. Yama58-4]
METNILSASYNNGSADALKIVGSPSYNNACRNTFRTVLQKKGVTVDVFGLCSGYWLFPLAEKNITESTCPLTSYEDVGSVVSYRSLSASCNNAKCSNPSPQASTSACGQSILDAAIMLTENDSQISDCYYVVTMRIAQAHFKSVYKSVFFLCDAVPPLANASINLTAISPPSPVAAPPVQGPDASAPSPSAKPSSPAPAPAPSLKRASFELQQFLEQEKQKAMLNELVAKLTEVCWDKCVTAAPGTKFSGSESSCLSNCAQRYLDVSGLVVRKFQSIQR